MLLNLSNINK